MPIYEYVCARCARKTEVIQGMNDPPPRVCPHCGGKLKKMASAPAFHLKGSGWYKTDYASPAGKAKEPSEKGETSESSEKPEKTEKAEKAGSAEKVEKSEKKKKEKKASE
ncbi:MAG TPA: FmdB family zinc ribbon protein [Thermoanaerobaculia bacterium]|jgi:putative FmdB family regulatory protein